MSVALKRNNNPDAVVVTSYNHELDSRIERSGFVHSKMTCISIYGTDDDDDDDVTISPPGFGIGGDHRRNEVVEDDSTSSTSSIGKNSDEEESSPRRGSDGSDDDEEVQSGYTGGGGLNNLEALEEVLPMKRSISQFYAGKSKSFTSLGDAVCCSSIKDIVKPENAFTRKRKNLLAYRNIWDKNGIRRSNSSGILKRHSNSNSNSRSNLALAASMACTESSRNSSDDSNSNSPSHSHCLPPLPPQTKRYPRNDSPSPPLQQKLSSWRSFSLSDLQGVAAIQSISGQKDQ